MSEGKKLTNFARRRRGELFQEGANDEEEGTHAYGGDEETELAPEGLDEEEDEDRGGDDLGCGLVNEE